MKPTIIKLKDEDVLDIKHLESNLSYGKDTKMKDKTYSRFRYQGTVFTVPDADTFVTDFLKGKVYSVTMIDSTRMKTDAEGGEIAVRDLKFETHVSSAQIIGIKTTSAIVLGLSEGTISAKDAMKMVDLEELAD
jgi:hypothetical protein